MALRPDCTGWSTDLRQMTPGATFRILSVSLALIGPAIDRLTSALTTRPSSSRPIGTSLRMRP